MAFIQNHKAIILQPFMIFSIFADRANHCYINNSCGRIMRTLKPADYTLPSFYPAGWSLIFGSKAVAAFKIPVSYRVIFSTAGACDSFNCPLNSTLISLPLHRLSSISYFMPALYHSVSKFSSSPLGILIYPFSSLPR